MSTLEEKLEELRKQWKTADETGRRLLEARAKALKKAMETKKEDLVETAERIFKVK